MKYRQIAAAASVLCAIASTAVLFAALWSFLAYPCLWTWLGSMVLIGATVELWRGVWHSEIRKEDLHG